MNKVMQDYENTTKVSSLNSDGSYNQHFVDWLIDKNKALVDGIEDVLSKWDKNLDSMNKVNLKILLSKDRTK